MSSGTSTLASRILAIALLLTACTHGESAAQSEPEYKRVYRAALDAAKADEIDEAYVLFAQSADLAQKAGDKAVLEHASKVLAQIDYNRGVQSSNASKYAEALRHFDEGIRHDSAFGKNYIGKGEALKKLGRHREAVAAFQGAAAHPDAEIAAAAKNGIRDNLVYMASVALSRNGEQVNQADAQEALKYLTDLQNFGIADADVFYYVGLSHKVRGDHAKAIQAADKALELHKGNKTDKARIYFLKGELLLLTGDKQGARIAFTEARYGEYKAAAEHYLKSL